LLVRGAVDTAERLGLSTLIISLMLVSLATSAPELVTSVQAALRDSPGIAVGNIVGSNIANVLLILGVAALIMPVAVQSNALRRDGGIGLLAALLLTAVGLLLPLDRLVGVLFIAGLAGYLVYAWIDERAAATGGHSAAFEKGAAYGELHRRRPPAGNSWRIAVALGTAAIGLAVIISG